MEEALILSVNYLGETKLIAVMSGTHFKDVVVQMREKWVGLEVDNFGCSCVVGEVSNVCLDSEDDLITLRLMCDLSNIRVIPVRLIMKKSNEKDKGLGGGELQCSFNCGTIVSISHDDLITADTPSNHVFEGNSSSIVLENNQFANAEGRTLLSDGWQSYIKCGKGIKFYGNVANFRVALIKYSSKLGFRFRYLRNGPVCIHVICIFNLDRGCGWFVKARPLGGNDTILMYSSDLKHTCSSNLFMKPVSDMITPSLIADLMLPNVQNKARLCAKDVVDAIKVGYGLRIPYWKANRAACIARHIVYGQHVDSYDEMFYYCKALQHTNPGSVVSFETDTATSRFKRVFVALDASIRGFKGCPPMLFVDGTFLRGRAKGILLVAIGKDGNRGLYPFAFALVSAENTPNWAWFLKNVSECVQHESRVSYFSDRNSGLMSAFPLVFREPVHFFCLYHLLANLKAKFSSGVARNNRSGYYDLFKDCAYELDKEKLDSKLIQFRSLGGKKADEFLSQLPLEKWAIAHAPSLSRFGEMTSNAAESFNAWILAARSLPINKIFDFIRSGLGRWFVERCAASNLWSGMLVPCKQEAWNIMSSVGMKWEINVCPGGIFEVLSVPSTSVNLNLRSCSCHKWEALGFPCVHAVAVIRMVRADVVADVESYYLSSTYCASYSWDINPVCETLINEMKSKMKQPKILAPVLNNPVGRPKSKKRVLSQGEFSRSKVKPE